MPAEASISRGKASSRRAIDWGAIVVNVALPLAGVVLALLVGAVMLLLLKADPIAAYKALVQGAVGSTFGLTQTLVKATPLVLVGAGICIAFRANVINIGGEGQIIMGALAGAALPLSFPTVPGFLLIPASCLAGFMAGAFWGFIPGILKARLKVNEILSTIMLNAIALQIMNLLLQGPLMDPEGIAHGTFLHQTAQLPKQAFLARLAPPTLLHSGALIALAAAIACYLFLWRTGVGFNIRAVGLNPQASRYSGIKVPFYEALSLTLAGGLAGLAGAIEVLGVQHRLLAGITGGYGFTGIVAALLGALHPIGLLPASVFFGALLVGADKMQRAVQVPSSLVTAMLGLIVLFVSGSGLWARRWAARRDALAARRRADSAAESAALAGAAEGSAPGEEA